MMNRLLAPVMFAAVAATIAACTKSSPTVRECVQYSPALIPHFADGLIRKDFRLANAWVVKSDKAMGAAPAYFLSADIVAPNGEAVVGTWVTDAITNSGRIYSVSPQATKYTNWGGVGDALTAGITVDTPGAKESRDCVMSHRAQATAPAAAPVAP